MAAKGSILKQEITKKILETFPNSFLYNDGKEIRIDGMEEGSPCQIKITLTAPKVAVENAGTQVSSSPKADVTVSNEQLPQEPTDEEKERLKTLLDRLGFSGE